MVFFAETSSSAEVRLAVGLVEPADKLEAALLNHLDLSAMRKRNLADQSQLTWLEARYHLDKVDLALQWQNNSGDASSAYGATAQKRAWQALLRYYF